MMGTNALKNCRGKVIFRILTLSPIGYNVQTPNLPNCHLRLQTDSLRLPSSSHDSSGRQRHKTHFLGHFMRVMQGVLPFGEHPPLFIAGQATGEPGGQSAAPNPNARQGHGGQMQRIQGRSLLCDCPKELKI